jgi:tetratricopeptide (TPR) repeat protein
VACEVLPTAQGRAWIWASTMAAWGYMRAGQFAEAIATSDRAVEAHRALSASPLAWNQSIHTTIRTLSLAFQGRLADAETCATEEHRRGVEDSCEETQWMTSMALASVHLMQGRLDDAVQRGREAARLGREHGRLIVLRGALVSQAEALAQLGRADEAQQALDECDAISVPGVGVLEPDVNRARGWLAVSHDDLPAATELFGAAATKAREVGDHVGEFHAMSDLARIGQVQGRRLDELAAVVGGPLVGMRASYARARRRNSAADLESVASSLEQTGALLLGCGGLGRCQRRAHAGWRRPPCAVGPAHRNRSERALRRRPHALAGRRRSGQGNPVAA